MKAPSFLRYSLVSIARNRRRSLYAIVGIALSTSLIAGSLVAVNTSASGLLRKAIAPTSVDFKCDDYSFVKTPYNATRTDEAVREIADLQYVKEASYSMTSDDWTLVNLAGQEYSSYGGGSYLAFVSPDNQMLIEGNRIHGSVPSPGTVAISRSAADALGVEVGQTVVISARVNDIVVDPVTGERTYGLLYLNLTYPISQIWTQDKIAGAYFNDRSDLLDPKTVYLNGNLLREPIVFNIGSYDQVMNSTVTEFFDWYGLPSPRLTYLVWIDRGSVVDISDLGGSIDRLNFIKERLNLVGKQWQFIAAESPLVNQVQSLGHDMDNMKQLFIELSIPVAALGVYLSVIGVDMGANSRRREAALLKARGASGGTVLGYLVLEAIVLGAFAAAVGLFAGVVTSNILFSSAPSVSSAIGGSSSLPSIANVGWAATAMALVFGMALMLLSSYGSFRWVSSATVREAIRHYSPDASGDDYSSAGDVVLIMFSAMSVASVLLTANFVNGHGWSWLTRLLVGALITWGILVFPFMPFFLSFGIVRLLTRGWRGLYLRFSWFFRPWTKELHFLVRRNIARNPRRASNLCVLIALALASGLFVSVTMESTVANQGNQVLFDYGSDIRVDGQWYGSLLSPGKQLNMSQLDAIATIPGVKAEVRYLVLSVKPFPYASGSELRVAQMDCRAYTELTSPPSSHFVGGGVHSLTGLETNGTVAMSQSALGRLYLEMGDRSMFDFSSSHWVNGVLNKSDREFPLTVAGAFTVLPGLSSVDMVVDERTMSWLTPKDISAAPFVAGVFITLSKGADTQAVEAAAKSIFQAAGLAPTVYVTADGVRALESGAGFGAMQGFLFMEYLLSVAIMSVGVGLLVFVSVEDRERELACAMARGLSGSQMRRMLMGESFTLMLLGIGVGLSVGLVASYLFNTVPPSSVAVPKVMEFTLVSWVLMGVSVISLAISSLLATVSAGKVRVAEVLRVRGG